MIAITCRKDQKLALFGLGGSGLATARALIAGGAQVIAFDDNPASVEAAREAGIATADLRETDFSEFDALVLSPGVPLTHPKPHWSAALAVDAGIPIVGDVGLFAEERQHVLPDCPFIAITGTNGKSTTTALIAHVLRSAGLDVQMGGNIGKAVLTLEPFDERRIYVIECSSYQIDLAPGIDPSTGILLNLAPDHLDRHGTMERYAEIKSRLVQGSALAAVGVDDQHSMAIAQQLASAGKSVVPFSIEQPLSDGIYARGSKIFDARSSEHREVLDLAPIATLRGRHNAQNACAAFAACSAVGLQAETIGSGMESFPGLAHRMEIIGNLGTTVFVNDSKGTNAEAAAMALSSFDNIHWIAGGLAKDGGIESLRPLFGRVAKAYLIGDAAPEFAATLGSQVDFEISGTIDVAVANAAEDAGNSGSEAVVLLSPACASFDQFRNFELRGEAFRDAVTKLEAFQVYGG